MVVGFIDNIQKDRDFMLRCAELANAARRRELEERRREAEALESKIRNDEAILGCQPYIDRFVECTEQAVRDAYEAFAASQYPIKISRVDFDEAKLKIDHICRGFHQVRRSDTLAYTKELIRPESMRKFIELLRQYEPSISSVVREYNEMHRLISSMNALRKRSTIEVPPANFIVVKFDPPLAPTN